MGNRVLTQDEVDALLKGVADEDIPVGAHPASEAKGVNAVDLTRCEQAATPRMSVMNLIYSRFCRELGATLSKLLSRDISIEIESSRVMRFGDFRKTIKVPGASLHILLMKPHMKRALVSLEGNFVFTYIDCLFGGKGEESTKLEGRDFSPIENRMIRRIINMILEKAESAWKIVDPAEFEYEGYESDPNLITSISPDELILNTKFQVDFLGQSKGYFVLCVSSYMIETVKQGMERRSKELNIHVDREGTRLIRRYIMESNVGLTVELGRTVIKVRDLLKLKVGDVIPLNKELGEELSVMIRGVPKLHCFPGISRGKRAVQITSAIKQDGERAYGRK